MEYIIAADIGGTNCRLGLFSTEDGTLTLDRIAWVETGNIAHADCLLETAAQTLDFDIAQASVLVVTIAGPVEGEHYGKLTNGNLLVDLRRHKQLFPAMRIRVINDFLAQAWAVLSREGSNATLLAGPQQIHPDTRRAIIGAGTGLGYASLSPTASGWLAQPSENGHAAFPFTGADEFDLATFLCARLDVPYATGDDVITGRGLAVLHEYLTGDKLDPADIGDNFLSRDTQTLAWYARLYAHPKWQLFLRNVPIRLITDKNSGIWGAARFGLDLLEKS